MCMFEEAYYALGSLVFLVILIMAWWTYTHGVPVFEKRLSALEAWIAAHVSGPPPS
jgi:hypothetical protein